MVLWYVVLYLAIINIFAFVLFGVDKRRARKQLWRISEKNLFLSAVFGGSVGALLGMYFFHHKTKHWYFVLGIPLILVVQAAILAVLWYLAAFVMTGQPQNLDEALAWQSEHYDTSFYEKLEKTDYTVTGSGEYVLHVQLLKNPKAKGRYIILSHGYTDNRIGSCRSGKGYKGKISGIAAAWTYLNILETFVK